MHIVPKIHYNASKTTKIDHFHKQMTLFFYDVH